MIKEELRAIDEAIYQIKGHSNFPHFIEELEAIKKLLYRIDTAKFRETGEIKILPVIDPNICPLCKKVK